MHNLEDALCAQTDPDAFFADFASTALNFALRLCRQCPLKEACLETALKTSYPEDYGIWGGTTRQERRRLRQERNRQYKLLEGNNNALHDN